MQKKLFYIRNITNIFFIHWQHCDQFSDITSINICENPFHLHTIFISSKLN
uniref:Uncharacterized protein n=1 Tax=Anguilla anguilla TaxID=7936 RepID=A0A0E9SFK7_ANGAN